jgi:hypothetical protein
MVSSYSEMVLLKHNVDCRLTMQADWSGLIFVHISLTGDQNDQRKVVATHRGQPFATSIGGTAIAVCAKACRGIATVQLEATVM